MSKIQIKIEGEDAATPELNAARAAQKTLNDELNRAKEIYLQTRGPMGEYVKQVQAINAAHKSGKTTVLEYSKALAAARSEYQRTAAINGLAKSIGTGFVPTAGPAGKPGMGAAGAMMGLRSLLPAVGIGMLGRASWGAFLEQDMAEARLAGVLRATGGGNGQSLGDLRDFAGMRQSKTAFGDESTLGAAAVLSTFQHIKGDQFKQTIVAAQDLATVMGAELSGDYGRAVETYIRFSDIRYRSVYMISFLVYLF